MTIPDPAQREAHRRLVARYGRGRDQLSPAAVMRAVQHAVFEEAELGGDAVPAEDVLAALAQVSEARAELDRLELDLIDQARARGANWRGVSEALGMSGRQGAESRAARLRRAAAGEDRDPSAYRLERARRHAADQWCEANAARIAQAAELLLQVVPLAWPGLPEEDILTGVSMSRARQALLEGAAPAVLFDELEGLHFRLSPHSRPAPAPAEQHAEQGEAARALLQELVGEKSAVRRAVLAPPRLGRPSAASG